MMKANLKAIRVAEIAYINLSEQLRDELVSKIENLFIQTRFSKYTTIYVVKCEDAAKANYLCAYLTGKVPGNYVLSGKLLQGVKIWFNMCYDDRLSVINKFKTYYQIVSPHNGLTDKPRVSVVFCKFLINELLSILADSRWKTLVNHAN